MTSCTVCHALWRYARQEEHVAARLGIEYTMHALPEGGIDIISRRHGGGNFQQLTQRDPFLLQPLQENGSRVGASGSHRKPRCRLLSGIPGLETSRVQYRYSCLPKNHLYTGNNHRTRKSAATQYFAKIPAGVRTLRIDNILGRPLSHDLATFISPLGTKIEEIIG